MGKNTKKNQAEYNKEARKKYNQKNFKYQTISFKIEELEAVNTYCKENNIPKNTLLRKAIMQYIGKPID
jgi:hypothetical protein